MNSKPLISLDVLETRQRGLASINDPRAYLATVYLIANRRLADAISLGRFERPELVVAMADCFIENYLAHSVQPLQTSQKAWQLTTLASMRPSTTLLQHLLLGLSALFRLELPRSLHAAFDKDALAAFKPDFLRINGVLDELYKVVWEWLAQCYKLGAFEDRFLENAGAIPMTLLNGFGVPSPSKSMEMIWTGLQKTLGKHTRAASFATAQRMYDAPTRVIAQADEEAFQYARQFYMPPALVGEVLKTLKRLESSSVAENCNAFESISSKAYIHP